MPDYFYDRLDYYRLLEAGIESTKKAREFIKIHRATLWRWKKAYDPYRGPFSHKKSKILPRSLKMTNNPRKDVLEAVRQAALEGNVPAAKLLLSELENQPTTNSNNLSVEQAIKLIQNWTK